MKKFIESISLKYLFVFLSLVSFPFFNQLINIDDRYIFAKLSSCIFLVCLWLKYLFIRSMYGIIIFPVVLINFILFYVSYDIGFNYFQDSNTYTLWLATNFICFINLVITFLQIRDLRRFFNSYIFFSITTSLIVAGYYFYFGLNFRIWSFSGPASVFALPIALYFLIVSTGTFYVFFATILSGSLRAAMIVLFRLILKAVDRPLFLSVLILSPLIFILNRDIDSMLISISERLNIIQLQEIQLFNFDFQTISLSRFFRAPYGDPHSLISYLFQTIGFIAGGFFIMLYFFFAAARKSIISLFVFLIFLSETFIFKEPAISALLVIILLRENDLHRPETD